jgi:acetylornithine/succinyldiaminopimelate/putrescine aminotransferase
MDVAQLSQILKKATGVVASRGEGVLLYDEDDRRYLDFTAGIGVTSTDHCHPRVVEAAQRQVATLIHGQYTTVLHRPLLTLVERLGDVLPPGLDRMFFANSGSVAIEAALRLSRQATGRPNIIVFHGGFHGRTVAAGTSGTKFRSGFSPLMAGVHVSPFPDPGHFGWPIEQATEFALAQLDYTLQTLSAPADTAAFFVEPVLGEGGYVPANQRFLEGLRERADAHGMLLVLDEVQTGFGRTGKFWPSAANRRGQARPDHRRARPWPDDRQRVSLRRRQTRRGNGGRRPTGGRPTRPVVADLRSVESGGPLHPGTGRDSGRSRGGCRCLGRCRKRGRLLAFSAAARRFTPGRDGARSPAAAEPPWSRV